MFTKYLKQFIAFILPIIGTAASRAIADEVIKFAYPERKPVAPRRTTSYSQIPRRRTTPTWEEHRAGSAFHDVLMVAFDLTGPSAEIAQQWLMEKMPRTGSSYNGVNLDSWWIANDERFDGSDTDSAIFVRKGDQTAARALLRQHGLVD